MCQLVSSSPAVNRAEPADFHCPHPSSSPARNLFSARLALGSPCRAALRLRYHKNQFLSCWRDGILSSLPLRSISISCPRNGRGRLILIQAPHSATLWITAARLFCLHSFLSRQLRSGFISCDEWRSCHGDCGPQRQDTQDVQLEQQHYVSLSRTYLTPTCLVISYSIFY